MTSYTLQPDEGFLFTADGVQHGEGLFVGHTDTLTLTNKRLILEKKGTFGNRKGVIEYPLSQIKIIDGTAQVFKAPTTNGANAMSVYFINGSSATFSFQRKSDMRECIEKTGQALTGESTATTNRDSFSSALPGSQAVAGVLKDTIGVFTSTFGSNKNKKDNEPAAPTSISVKCDSCGAPINGVHGQVVNCEYCDTPKSL